MHCKCKGTGWVVAVEKKSGAVYSFRCGCEVSDRRNISKSIPSWNLTLSDRFDADGLPHLPGIETKVVEPDPTPPIKDFQTLMADPHAYDDEDSPF